MTITVSGNICKKGFGFGVWALETTDGKVYELKDPAPELTKITTSVTVEGIIREDIMTIAAIGPVLEVKSFQKNS